jgi:hypothetical protein
MVLPQSPHKGDTVTFDSHDIAGNPSGKSGAATKAPPVCLPPSVDTDFNPVTGSKTTNRLLVVRERAYEVSPDLTLYGAPGTHTYVQSLLFHTRDNERDGEVTAATITFSPGVTILATITSTRLLGGARGDRVATFSDAMFGIFGDPKTRNTNWNKYAGKDRGLEKRGDRFEVINDGRDGQPARIELEFPTTVGPDQSRVIIDYGDCWAANVSVNVEFHTPRQNKVYHKYTQYQGRVLGSPSPNGAPAAGNGPGLVLTPQVAPPTIDNLSDDTGPSATDRVTSDNTPELSGTSLANSSVRLTLNGALVDTVLADDTGRWSYLSPTLAPGNYSVEAASAVDDAISSMSDPFRFTITDL